MMLSKILLTGAFAALLAGAAQAQVSVKIGVLNDRSGIYSDISGEGSVVIAFYNPAPVSEGRAIRFRLRTGEVLEEWATPAWPQAGARPRS